MAVEAAIRTVMIENAPLCAAIGGVSPRIYPEARAGALPCIVMGLGQDEALQSLTARVASKAEIEVVCIATSKAEAAAINALVITALQGFTGTKASTLVMHCLHLKATTAYQPPAAGETTGAFLHTSIFSVMYQ